MINLNVSVRIKNFMYKKMFVLKIVHLDIMIMKIIKLVLKYVINKIIQFILFIQKLINV
jgi:hypothetical protein